MRVYGGVAWLCLSPTPGARPAIRIRYGLRVTTDFVASRVQESSRNGGATPLTSNARFAATLLRAGLSARTVWETVTPIWLQSASMQGFAWRQACLLDLYQYDLFRGLNARYDVRFADASSAIASPTISTTTGAT